MNTRNKQLNWYKVAELVFALELLIISDLLVTIISRSLDDMIIVGALVLIRTVIAYFLNKEIEVVSANIKP